MSEWQPIETAPKDGSPVLLAHVGGVRGVARYTGSYWRYEAAVFWTSEPTHWMSPPDPPTPLFDNRTGEASAEEDIVNIKSSDPGTVAVASGPTAEDIRACAWSTLIGFQHELGDSNIEFICDQISRKATLTHSSTNQGTPVMRAAENAAKVVEGWSDSKKEYADRVVSSQDRA